MKNNRNKNIFLYKNFLEIIILKQRVYNKFNCKSLFQPHYISELSIHAANPILGMKNYL